LLFAERKKVASSRTQIGLPAQARLSVQRMLFTS